MKKVLTLCIPVAENKVLLGLKKRGLGAGLWNGFGGKVHDKETIIQATLRELQEECNITDGTLSKMGVLDFIFENDPTIFEVHIFKLTNFKTTPKESEEMRPQWFLKNEIPFEKMWPDDAHWIPLFLQNKLFTGKFIFDKPSSSDYAAKIISHQLIEVLKLD